MVKTNSTCEAHHLGGPTALIPFTLSVLLPLIPFTLSVYVSHLMNWLNINDYTATNSACAWCYFYTAVATRTNDCVPCGPRSV